MKTTDTGNLIIEGKEAILEHLGEYSGMYLLDTAEELPIFPMREGHFKNWVSGEELRYALETTDVVDVRVKVITKYGLIIPRQYNTKGQ